MCSKLSPHDVARRASADRWASTFSPPLPGDKAAYAVCRARPSSGGAAVVERGAGISDQRVEIQLGQSCLHQDGQAVFRSANCRRYKSAYPRLVTACSLDLTALRPGFVWHKASCTRRLAGDSPHSLMAFKAAYNDRQTSQRPDFACGLRRSRLIIVWVPCRMHSSYRRTTSPAAPYIDSTPLKQTPNPPLPRG